MVKSVKQLDELDDKEVKLKSISDEQDKHRRLQQLTSDRAKRGVADARKKLQHERSLKLGAFSRVDQLQTQVCNAYLWINPYNAELFLYKPRRPKGFFDLKSS